MLATTGVKRAYHGAQMRLRTGSDFSRVFGRRASVAGRYFVVFGCPSDVDAPRLGMAVGRKHFARAVMRNRLKRLLRESFAQHARDLAGLDIVVLPRRGCHLGEPVKWRDDIASLWQRVEKKCNAPLSC